MFDVFVVAFITNLAENSRQSCFGNDVLVHTFPSLRFLEPLTFTVAFLLQTGYCTISGKLYN